MGIIEVREMTRTGTRAPGAELGRGAHAVVYALSGTVALKLSLRRALHDELVGMEEGHAHVVQHAHVVRILARGVGWLAMELVDGCSLAHVLEREGSLQQPRLARAVSDVVAGLATLHAHGSPHRDLKPSNVLQERSTQRCKLIDWIGRAAEDASLARGKPVGTPVFMAPEVAGAPHRHGLASDTWALGCTVINLASGRLPWADADAHGRTNEFMAMWLAAHGQAPPRDESAWSPELSAFVVRCFEPDPARRALARELRQEQLLQERTLGQRA